MTARLLTMLVLWVALLSMPAVALGGDARHASNRMTFADSIGEDPAAPDITTVTVSNDDGGLITFQITVSNRPAMTADMYFQIFLDTDSNPSTGASDALGADYAIELDPGSVGLFQWNGTDFVAASSQTSLVYTYSATGPTIRIRAADLGGTRKLSFGVIAASGAVNDTNGEVDPTKVHRDYAPDAGHGFNAYPVVTKLVLKVTAVTAAPKPALAGRGFSVSLAATQNDTNAPVQRGTVSCAASIAGKRIPAVTHAVRNGVAVCVWRIPAAAKGKTVRGLITLTVRGTSVTRGFAARVV